MVVAGPNGSGKSTLLNAIRSQAGYQNVTSQETNHLQRLAHSSSALGAFYRRLCSRMDKPSANTATAHKLSRMVYFMLTRGEDFVDQGQQNYEEQQRHRSIAALKRRAAALGFEINPTAAAA